MAEEEGGAEAESGELKALRQKVSELQKQLKSHVWTSAMATVANMEEAAMGIKMDAEEATLPRRIAALEKSVFGRSASEADLEYWSTIEGDFKKLQFEYEELKLEYIKERDKPPQIIKQDDRRTQQLEKDLKKSQGMYQLLNSKYTTLNVDYLKLDTDFQELTKAHEKLLTESQQFKAETGVRIKRLQEQQTKNAVELKRLRGANSKIWEEHKSLQEQHEKVCGDTRALAHLTARYDTKQGQFEDLETEVSQLRDENDDLRTKSYELRKKLGQGVFYTGAGNNNPSNPSSRVGSKEPAPIRRGSKELKDPMVYASAPAALSSPKEGSRADVTSLPREDSRAGTVSLPRLPAVDEFLPAEEKPERTLEEEHRMGDEEFFGKFPELREPKEQKDNLLKNKMSFINGRVKYCDERWQEWYFKSSKIGPGLTKSSPAIHKSSMKYMTG